MNFSLFDLPSKGYPVNMIRLSGLDRASEARVQDALTFQNPDFDGTVEDEPVDTGGVPNDPRYVFLWDRAENGDLLVPRHFKSPETMAVRAAVDGYSGQFEHRCVYIPKDEQRQITDQLDQMRDDVGIMAPCGFGKTFLALYYAAKFKGRILICVPNTNKLNEWKREAQKILGLPPEMIGHVQADKRIWEDKPVVVAMLKTLAIQKFPEAFERGFSTVLIDEAHLVTSRVLSRALGKVGGVRVALTATPGSGLRRRIIESHCGNHWLSPQVERKVCQFDIVPVEVGWKVFKPAGQGRSWEADWDRQKFLVAKEHFYVSQASDITEKLMNMGRRTLVLSNTIEPLSHIYGRVNSGGFIIGEPSLKTVMEQHPNLNTFISSIEAKNWKQRVAIYQEKVKAVMNPILGTGLTKTQPAGTGMDVPDLDGGLLFLPTPNIDLITQLKGRWDRPHPGKQQPLIVVMVPNTPNGNSVATNMARALTRLGSNVSFHEPIKR
jgi:hypothetical protein